jgi:polar amino acid transport system ATP-binding protein
MLDGELLPRNWDGMRRVRQRMGMAFQNFELFPHKMVLGNVTVGSKTVLQLSREARSSRTARVHSARKVGLADKAARDPLSAIRWAATARRDRPGFGDGAGSNVVR